MGYFGFLNHSTCGTYAAVGVVFTLRADNNPLARLAKSGGVWGAICSFCGFFPMETNLRKNPHFAENAPHTPPLVIYARCPARISPRDFSVCGCPSLQSSG